MYSDIVRIRAPNKYIKRWKSQTKKTDAIWYNYDSYTQESIVQLVATSQQPRLENSGTLEDIELELEKMPVCQDSVRPQKDTPTQLKTVQTFLDHPGFDGDRDFIRSRFRNVREHWLNHQELVNVNQDLIAQGYARGIQDFKKKYVNPHNPKQIFYCVEVGECEYG